MLIALPVAGATAPAASMPASSATPTVLAPASLQTDAVTGAAPETAVDATSPPNDPFDQLARLTQDELATGSPQAQALLQAHFKDECAKNDALPFDRVCDHYAARSEDSDPSPWPDLMLGIRADRIVSAVLFDPRQTLSDAWQCADVSGADDVRACAAADVAPADRKVWLERWARFFATAD